MLIWGKTKLLKIVGDKLLKDLLTNKAFSKQIVLWNFKMELYLKNFVKSL